MACFVFAFKTRLRRSAFQSLGNATVRMMSMKSIKWSAFAGIFGWLMAVAVTASAQVTEVVPTSRAQPATWRNTVDAPAGNAWTQTGFDDSNWQTGRAPFGTAGTPGITTN